MDSSSTQVYDYRGILLDCFKQRQERNSGYSMRAFARDIDISHSRLSEIFSGKGELSVEKSRIIAKKLKLSPQKAVQFKDMVVLATNANERLKKAALRRLSATKIMSNELTISSDQFNLIADPRYTALYTCMMLNSFDGKPESLMRLMNMNSLEVFEILSRLQRLGLAELNGGIWSAKDFNVNIDSGIPTEWTHSYHKEMSSLGRKSVDQFAKNERHLDSLVIPIDIEKYGEIQQKIIGFFKDLLSEYSSGKDAVYGLTLQFFPMSKSDLY
jgi:uncharacterized protein (TIGR02147 family)